MATGAEVTTFDRGTDILLTILTREQPRLLVNYRGDDEIRARIEELAECNTQGALTEAERAE